MAAVGEPREIECRFMYLLHKWRFGVDNPILAKDSIDFFGDSIWFQYMFQNRLCYYAIDRTIRKRNIVAIRNKLD